ncbi:MAG: sigma D regulator [Alteromonadaceae bacterium]|nr:MAG: sigma D regulator [Alteromonadaceae bacterium]
MLENCKSAQERWGGVSNIIDRWLVERQDLLVQYCELSEAAGSVTNYKNCGSQLQSLCQILVDYISAGHFEVYDQLMREGRDFDDQEGLKRASKSFEIVDSSTEYILDFNDKYQETDDTDDLIEDLSHLGEVLASRFEAEDSMIKVLHVAHKDQATT